MVPALLRGAATPSNPGSPSDPLLHLWDSTVTTLVRSVISPNCSRLGGDLYILTGRGRLGAQKDGDECQTQPLWSAACCAVPVGRRDFSVGLIREAAEGEKRVSVRELEEALGAEELFSEGCRGALGGGVEATADLLSKGVANTVSQTKDREEADSGGAHAEAAARAGVAQTSSADAAASEGEEQQEVTQSTESSSADETAAEQDADHNSSSALLLVMSTTASVLTSPLRPVFSTVTQLPGQVVQVDLSSSCTRNLKGKHYIESLNSSSCSYGNSLCSSQLLPLFLIPVCAC